MGHANRGGEVSSAKGSLLCNSKLRMGRKACTYAQKSRVGGERREEVGDVGGCKRRAGNKGVGRRITKESKITSECRNGL